MRAGVNTDLLGRLFEPGSLAVLGAESSDPDEGPVEAPLFPSGGLIKYDTRPASGIYASVFEAYVKKTKRRREITPMSADVCERGRLGV